MSDENPREIKQLIARCEANELTFDNHDMSVALTEIARLRLTDAEREVLQRARQEFPEDIVTWWHRWARRDPTTGESLWAEVATVIDAVLERHAKGGGAIIDAVLERHAKGGGT